MTQIPDENPQNVTLLENIHVKAQNQFLEHELLCRREESSLSGELLYKSAQNSQILGIRSKTRVREEDFEKLTALQTIGCFCIGTDQVDLRAAKLRGIPVFNAPYSNTRSVAELVISEIIALSRKLGDVSRNVHAGIWAKSAVGSFEIRGKTLGIVGYGHIGSQVSIMAEALGMNVIFYDNEKKLPLGNSRPCATLGEVLKSADFVTLHVPDTEDTRWMIQKPQLLLMKKGAFLLNLSRGTVVKIEDLADSIQSGQLAGAAVDVFPVEPESNKERFSSPLQGLPNVLLTPHIGGSTEEAQEAIAGEVSTSLLRFALSGNTMGAVNFPQVSVPPLKKGYRLLNVHQNVPGVLGEINSIVSQRGVNISAQYLSTDSDIGYLVMDLETQDARGLAEQIQSLKITVRTRIIEAAL